MADDANEVSPLDKVAEVMRIIETLDYPELVRLHDLIGEEYTQKTEAEKAIVIVETQRRFEQLGLMFEEVIASQRNRKRAVRTPAVAKYRSPDGKECLDADRLQNGFGR
jgi:hypothetical protein